MDGRLELFDFPARLNGDRIANIYLHLRRAPRQQGNMSHHTSTKLSLIIFAAFLKYPDVCYKEQRNSFNYSTITRGCLAHRYALPLSSWLVHIKQLPPLCPQGFLGLMERCRRDKLSDVTGCYRIIQTNTHLLPQQAPCIHQVHTH